MNTTLYSMKIIGSESNCGEFLMIMNGEHPERNAYEELRDFEWYFECDTDEGFCLYLDGYCPLLASVSFGKNIDNMSCSLLLEESRKLNLSIEVYSVCPNISMAEYMMIKNGIATEWKLAGYYYNILPYDVTALPYDWEVCDPQELMIYESTLSK